MRLTTENTRVSPEVRMQAERMFSQDLPIQRPPQVIQYRSLRNVKTSIRQRPPIPRRIRERIKKEYYDFKDWLGLLPLNERQKQDRELILRAIMVIALVTVMLSMMLSTSNPSNGM